MPAAVNPLLVKSFVPKPDDKPNFPKNPFDPPTLVISPVEGVPNKNGDIPFVPNKPFAAPPKLALPNKPPMLVPGIPKPTAPITQLFLLDS